MKFAANRTPRGLQITYLQDKRELTSKKTHPKEWIMQ